MSTPPSHPWRLVAPWYRWQRAAVPQYGRSTAPVFQKFAGSNFLQDFLEQPQHSLVFDATTDVVSNIDLVSAVSGGNLPNKLAALFATKTDGTPVKPNETADINVLKNLNRARLVPTNLRKLFLPVHDRHYLIVCELHCDMPGFPTVDRKEVCQAGFVVRRRQRNVPPALMKEAGLKAQELRDIEAEYAELLELSPLNDEQALARKQKILALKKTDIWDQALQQIKISLDEKRSELNDWFISNNINVTIEGWFAESIDGKSTQTLGHWGALSAEQQSAGTAITEHFYPLYPLVPDPREPEHDAAGRTLYYGIVPVTSLQHEVNGRSRFDDVNTYEIRCFVRRHHPCPNRIGKTPDCHGDIVWSRETEPYRIAPPFDTLGCANRPISIKMPDLRELAAQVMARPRGKLSSVKFIQPQHLSPKVKNGSAAGGDMGGNAICFFSIPLIAIIALFVLNLFLPIVTFIFQLWFLLVLRFCIPPQIKFGADLDAALSTTPPGIDFDADFAISVNGTALSAFDLNTKLKSNIKTRIGQDTGMDSRDVNLESFSNNALGPLDQSLIDNKNMPHDPQTAHFGLDYASGLRYEPHRDPEWRLTGGRG
jgi:hypothetical protein